MGVCIGRDGYGFAPTVKLLGEGTGRLEQSGVLAPGVRPQQNSSITKVSSHRQDKNLKAVQQRQQ